MTQTQSYPNVPRKHHLAKCEECPLYDEGSFVPSSGPEKAKLVLVGEAPGKQEVTTGVPFTGVSGKLLDALLQQADIDREEVFITNTCLCRPKGNATPGKKAREACKERLIHEIEMRDPEMVVSLGNVASQTLLARGEGITKLRVGPPKKSPLVSAPVLATFHPAATLYNASSFPDLVTDFGKLKGDYNAGRDYVPPRIRIIDDISEALGYLSDLEKDRPQKIAVDIETRIDKEEHFGHPDRYSFLCIGISLDGITAIVFSEGVCNEREFRSSFGRVLDRHYWVAQNGKFDMAALALLNREAAFNRLYFDTMLAHYCLDERRGVHSLDYMSIEYLGSPDWKVEIKRYLGADSNFADIPRSVLYPYNGYDVGNTYRLYELFEGMLEKEDLTRTHYMMARTSPTLMAMELNGLAVDLEVNAALKDIYTEQMSDLKRKLSEVLEWPDYNPNSWQQVTKALLEIFKVPKRMVPNTQKETLVVLAEWAAKKGNKTLVNFLGDHLEFKSASKSYGTYVKGIRERVYDQRDGIPRVHTSFLQHGSVTGRLSSRNPNLQNITRGSVLRGQFVVSSPDNVFIQADYRQAELRVVCCLARDAYLRDIFSNERDLHSEVATRFFGANFTKEQRVRAKAVVFGLTYGREAFSLAAEFRISTTEAQRYINSFFELIPETIAWRESVKERVLTGQDLINPFGRRRRFHLITKENKNKLLKEAYAFLPQSTASDINLEAANRLARHGLWDYLRVPVHDSLLLEVPQEEAGEVSQLIKDTMEQVGREVFGGYVDFPVDVAIGKNWGEL